MTSMMTYSKLFVLKTSNAQTISAILALSLIRELAGIMPEIALFISAIVANSAILGQRYSVFPEYTIFYIVPGKKTSNINFSLTAINILFVAS